MKAPEKKLSIAIVSDAIYPYNIGGKEKRIYELSTRLAARGHQVTIYTMKWWKGNKKRVTHEGVVHEAISPLYPLYAGERRSMKEAVFFALHCFRLLSKKFDVLDADHMPHLVLFPLKIVCLLKRKKLTATWNEVWGRKYWIKYLGVMGNIAYAIEYISAKLPNQIISISEHTTKRLKKDLNVHTTIITIPMGINIEHINSIKPSRTKSDLIFAGRLLEHKNVDYIIKTVAILKTKIANIKCIIVGDGPEKLKLVHLTKKLNLSNNIQFNQFLPNYDDLYALMKSSKVFIFPSSREGFGIVAIEAIASGIPVITINHKDNAAKDIITNGKSGYVINCNEKEMADKVLYIFNNRLAGIENYAKNYDWENLLNYTERAYLR